MHEVVWCHFFFADKNCSIINLVNFWVIAVHTCTLSQLFSIRGRTMILIATVPCHCLSSTLDYLICFLRLLWPNKALSDLIRIIMMRPGGGGGYTESLASSPILVISLKCSS